MGFHNFYNIGEVDSMLSERVKDILLDQDKKIAVRREQFDIELTVRLISNELLLLN